jgi:hypothetical protein
VWDPETDTLLKKDYFCRNPDETPISHQLFVDTYFMDSYRRWRDAIRAVHPDSILILQGPTLETPPRLKGTADEDPRMAYAPHWYDGITLMTKHFNRTWNVDVVGVLRGRYWSPVMAIRIGETAIRNCFRGQIAALRQEALDLMGTHPVVMTEFGIPYDMDDGAAYKTGDYTAQAAAMDANYYGVEGSGLEGHCLWVYMPTNDHAHGDQWNGEDLSIVSRDDRPLPLPAVPPRASTADQPRPSATELGFEDMVTPSNVQRILTNASIGSDADGGEEAAAAASTKPAAAVASTTSLSLAGHRAAEAFVRPSPVAVAGDIKSYGFDLRSCTFDLVVKNARAPDGAAAAAEDDDEDENAPTVVFLPDYHFPRDACDVRVSSGRWELRHDDEGAGAAVQMLYWWHDGGDGEQTLQVKGPLRRHENGGDGGADADEWGYLSECYRTGGGACAIM